MATFYPRDAAFHNSRHSHDFSGDEIFDGGAFPDDLSHLLRNGGIFIAGKREGNEVSDMLDLSKVEA